MDIAEAKKMAKEVATENELFGWRIFFGKDETVGGTCYHDFRTIELTETFILDNSKDVCTNLILHEIAHALVGGKNGHGDIWKAKCVEIGAYPNEFMEGDMAEFSNFVLPRRSSDCTAFFKLPEISDEHSDIINI